VARKIPASGGRATLALKVDEKASPGPPAGRGME
jgi:hypothetical protein